MMSETPDIENNETVNTDLLQFDSISNTPYWNSELAQDNPERAMFQALLADVTLPTSIRSLIQREPLTPVQQHLFTKLESPNAVAMPKDVAAHFDALFKPDVLEKLS